MSGALDGIKVLEISEFVSGPYCTKMMADLGADVIKVESLEGDVARRLGPFPDDIPDGERSGLFLYLNTNKRGVTLDLSSDHAKDVLGRLVGWADILVTNYSRLEALELGIGSDALHRINPRLIVTSITPFGLTGPYRDYRSYYLNRFQAGGEGYCLPGGLGWLLYSDREPIKAGGYLGEYDVGISAAVASLAAITSRDDDPEGEGETIDISAQQALLDTMRFELDAFNDGWVESRATRALPVGGLIQCKDGFVEVMPLEQRMWEAFVELMGSPDWATEPQYAYHNLMSSGFVQGQDELGRIQMEVNDRIGEWALNHTKQEIYDEGQRLGCAIGKVLEADELFADAQLNARGYFIELEHPLAGKVMYAGAAYRFSETPPSLEHPAPLLGQHNDEVYAGLLRYAEGDLVDLRASKVI